MKKVVAFFGEYGNFRSSHGTSGRTHKMTTYQRQLLDKLIAELTVLDPSIRIAQMIAAELKGAMQAQDTPTEPTPDADGWVENTGTMPECEIKAYKYRDGAVVNTARKTGLRWDIQNLKGDITHYRPA